MCPEKTIVDLLRARALQEPAHVTYTFLVDGEGDEVALTNEELDARAKSVAGVLQAVMKTGERALLLFPPGPDFVVALFGCLYAGVIAVPAYPPDPQRLGRTLPRLLAVARDAGATVVLTSSEIAGEREGLVQAEDLRGIPWLTMDTSDRYAGTWKTPRIEPGAPAILQYTSGSTSDPRGVVLTHQNLLHNLAFIERQMGIGPGSSVVFWVPPYHDMGLIGGVLEPLYARAGVTLMSPVDFLRRPIRWLNAVSRKQARISGGPNFAYDLCVRKVPLEQRCELDLRCWEVAFNGAEPVRSETLERFAAAFEPCGFKRTAFFPCYGLAEATLCAAADAWTETPVVRRVDAIALREHRVAFASNGGGARDLVGCGQSAPDQEIVVVDPESLRACAPGCVGEIWLAGPSVAAGYWNRPEETARSFGARIAGSNVGPYLRTGDLGFMEKGELFVTGRMKDAIVVRGRNHYPQDIERTVEQCHAALRPGCGAAFAIDADGEERLIVAHEVERRCEAVDADEVAAAVRQAIASDHELNVWKIVLLRAGSLPKTSSGKVQRLACRGGYLADALEVVAERPCRTTGLPSHVSGRVPDRPDVVQIP